MPQSSWALPHADIEYVKQLIVRVKAGFIVDLEHFFMNGLVGYYDAMWDGMSTEVGHLMYRLSDLVPENERRKMTIYPSETGSLIHDDGGTWDSLEDFRAEWERVWSDEGIPEFDFSDVPELQAALELSEGKQ